MTETSLQPFGVWWMSSLGVQVTVQASTDDVHWTALHDPEVLTSPDPNRQRPGTHGWLPRHLHPHVAGPQPLRRPERAFGLFALSSRVTLRSALIEGGPHVGLAGLELL